MVKWLKVCTRAAPTAVLGLLVGATPGAAGDIYVGPGDNLQAAIDAARPGDRLMLAPDAVFSGNFVLPNKGSSEVYITIRSAAPDAVLPPEGVRVGPSDAPNLPLIQSPTVAAAMIAGPGAHHWRLQFLEFGPNLRGFHEIISLGVGDSSQDTLAEVPHHLVLDRVYVHGDPVIGQKRGVGLNSGAAWILDSHISDIKGVGFDTQAVAGYNGPGPWTLVNNYLEGAGENVLIGGATAPIAGINPADLQFIRNHMTKPVSWRSPILPAPTGVTATGGTGGSLPAGTYSYRITATLKTAQDSWAFSPRSTEVVASVGSSGRVSLTWTAVPNAIAYRVYRGTSAGAQDRYFDVTTSSFTDSGQSGGVADTGNWITGTVWTVKNVFELKAGERVLVDGNVIENCWLQGQNGIAVLFTPRSQDGTSDGIEIRDVLFTRNLVRHAGGALNILGYDNNGTTGQTRNITIRDNVFSDISAARWGGNGRLLLIGDEPRDIVLDHNTVDHDGSIIVAYGGNLGAERQILGFVLTNNLFRHNEYGIIGSSRGVGNDTLNAFFPNAVVLRNTFAGGNSGQYPANNEFPTVPFWQSQFVNYSGANYALVSGSPYIGTGTDGKNLGADVNAVTTLAQAALTGRAAGTPVTPVSITTTALPGGAVLTAYAAQLNASGGSGSYAWSLTSGQLPPGLALSASTGAISGVPSQAGLFSFTARAADSADSTNADTRALQISISGAAPQVTLVSPTQGAVITGSGVALQASATDADGTVVRVDFYAGTSKVATSTGSPWTATWTGVQPGGYQITATATDSQGLTATSPAASITVQDAPAPPPPPPPPTTERPDGEIVIHAADVTRVAGRWRKQADSSAASGMKVTSTDAGWSMTSAAPAEPVDFFEAAFDAPAGVAYQVWFRMRAVGDLPANDSIWVQYSDAVTPAGAPLYRLGTASAMGIALEDCSGCGVGGWGWQDRAYWAPGSYVQFAGGGTHAIRVQLREDGVELDQIVLTPASANAPAPGPARGDATILARSAGPSSDVVLYASDVSAAAVRGMWQASSSGTSPDGVSLRTDDGRWSTAVPVASPANYFDVTFAAAANRSYRVWVRLKAAKNSAANDAVWLQFSDAISGAASAVYRIGTTGGFGAALDDCKSCKPVHWGWTNGAGGLSQPTSVTFAWSGMHTLRVQVAEDGVEIDQLVLSPVRFANSAPGAPKNDATIVPKP